MAPNRKAIPPHLQRKIDRPAASVPSSDNECALVLSPAHAEDEPPAPSGPNSIISASIKHNFTPTELVQQDVIDTLRSQVEDLTMRCDRLDEENAHLRVTLAKLAHLLKGSALGGSRAPNLVGYESSDDGIASNDHAEGGPSSTYANQIAVILTRHEDRLADLEARSTNMEINGLQVINGKSQHTTSDVKAPGGTSGEDGLLTHRLESLEQIVESGLRQTNKYHIELQDLQIWRSNINDEQGSKALKTTSAPAPQYDADFQARTERKSKQELHVDMTFSRDELFQHYQELSELIQDYRDDGNFQGTDDELWSLRERVITNIAILDQREKALEGIKEWMKYNGS
ncbi:hypothetical protein DOTSEDRAFT_20650 [Dothistroma septosporum NZE10]|uniref:Uncharacterized protein n=1 Tax=Dothistroma septosporum (strain NZE10 / CBS 128990) TaxID=675120 RepID=N1Q3C2_DOTSN|nr:hypothetical protein DOTSEDRAFT_20650 [Dothistroma septosporum NZE10]